MPRTAFRYFNENIARAKALVSHASQLPSTTAAEQLLRDDVLRSAWMFAVGASDAYFCDAYSDLLAATLTAQQRQPTPKVTLPDVFLDIQLPVRAVLQHYATNTNWRWRMAARKLMERADVLGIDAIKKLFNRFLPKSDKLFDDAMVGKWILLPTARKRLFGITAAQFQSLAANPAKVRSDAVTAARKTFERRIQKIIQRRHDCIHACDRPRVSPQAIGSHGTVFKVVEDIEFLVTQSEQHLLREIPKFLSSMGCTPTTITQVGY